MGMDRAEIERRQQLQRAQAEQLVRDLGSPTESVRQHAGQEIARMAATDIRPFGDILERPDIDIELKRSLMRILQVLPGAVGALAQYRIPPLG